MPLSSCHKQSDHKPVPVEKLGLSFSTMEVGANLFQGPFQVISKTLDHLPPAQLDQAYELRNHVFIFIIPSKFLLNKYLPIVI
jgi:hypothetical protein